MSIFEDEYAPLTEKIIACGIEVHDKLGPGFLEPVYQQCFSVELKVQGLSFERHRSLPLVYRGIKIQASYCCDFVVEKAVVVEVKAVETLAPRAPRAGDQLP